MTKLTIMTLALCLQVGATTIVNFEDLSGLPPASDRDFNDIQISVTGLSFDVTGEYTFAGYNGIWSGSTETALMSGEFFDFATVTGPVTIAFYDAQSAYVDQPWVMATDGEKAVAFDPAGWAGSTPEAFDWAVGDKVTFTEVTPGGVYYNDASLNPGGLPMMVVSDPPDAGAPEPGTVLVIGAGLAALGMMRRRHGRAKR